MKKLIYLLLILICVSGKLLAQDNILFLSDIHFNPYALCKEAPCATLTQLIESDSKYWPQILARDNAVDYKIETSNGFLINGLNNLTPIIKQDNIHNVFVTGDILAHSFDKQYFKYAPEQYNNQHGLTNFSLKVSAYILNRIESATNNAAIFYVLGNNDGDHSDYINPSIEYFSQLAKILSAQLPKAEKKSFERSFSSAGYFSLPLNNKTLIIGLNSILLARYNPDKRSATIQLEWLNKTLAHAKFLHKQVILLQHIPYGINTYNSFSTKESVMLLDTQLQKQYLALIKQYHTTISGIYAGHFHADYFELLPGSEVPLVATVAFNSLFGNNPGFKVLNLDESGHLLDYIAYNTNLAQNKKLNWQVEYRLSSAYHNSNIKDIIRSMPHDINSPAVFNYRHNYNGNNDIYLQPISSESGWNYYYCALTHVTIDSYETCLKHNQKLSQLIRR